MKVRLAVFALVAVIAATTAIVLLVVCLRDDARATFKADRVLHPRMIVTFITEDGEGTFYASTLGIP